MSCRRWPVAVVLFLAPFGGGVNGGEVMAGDRFMETRPGPGETKRLFTEADTSNPLGAKGSHRHRNAFRSTARTVASGHADLSTTLLCDCSIRRPGIQVLSQVAVGLTPSFTITGGLLMNPEDFGRYFDLRPKVRLWRSEIVTLAFDDRTTLKREWALVAQTPTFENRSVVKRKLAWTFISQPRLIATLEQGRALGSVGVGIAFAAPGLGADQQVVPPDESSAAINLSVGGAVHIHPELSLITDNQAYFGIASEARFGRGPWAAAVERGETLMQSRSGVRGRFGPYGFGIGAIVRDIPRHRAQPHVLSYLRLSRAVFGGSK